MSRPLIPRPTLDGSQFPPTQTTQRPKKISTACGACKARKTRCSGGNPCDACAIRNSSCIYDATSDQRRKVANQRNIHDLENAQRDLDRHRELLGGIIATIRAGDSRTNTELIQLIRSGVDLSQLAAHVRNECRSNISIQHAYEAINFVIDGPEELPSPIQILGHQQPLNADPQQGVGLGTAPEHDMEFDALPAEEVRDRNLFNLDPTL